MIVDKLEKLPRDKVEQELATLGVAHEAIDGRLRSSTAPSARVISSPDGLLMATSLRQARSQASTWECK